MYYVAQQSRNNYKEKNAKQNVTCLQFPVLQQQKCSNDVCHAFLMTSYTILCSIHQGYIYVFIIAKLKELLRRRTFNKNCLASITEIVETEVLSIIHFK